MQRAMTYGLLAAAGSAAWMLLEFVLGFHTTRAEVGRWTGFAGMVFPIVAIVLLLRATRLAHAGPGFSSGLKLGAVTGLTYAVMLGATVWAYFTWVNPGFQVEGESVDTASQVTAAAVGGLVVCLIAALIAVAVMRRAAAGALK